METIAKMETPKGLKLETRFFLRNKGQSNTTIEMYIFKTVETIVQLPPGFYTRIGDTVTAQSHIQDGFGKMQWNVHELKSEGLFWEWFERTMISERDKYEVSLEPFKK